MPTRRVVLDQLLANYGAAQRSACLDSIATAVRTAYDAFQLLDAHFAEPRGSRSDGPLGFETKFAERAGEVKRGE